MGRGLSPIVSSSSNVDNGLATLYIMTGTITAIDLATCLAEVDATCGHLVNVRVSLPFYGSGGQISAAPRIGDSVVVAADSQNNRFILTYFSNDPSLEQKAYKLKLTDRCIRLSNWDNSEILLSNDIVLSTLNGNVLSVNNNLVKPAVSIDTAGRINLTVSANTATPHAVVIDSVLDSSNNPTSMLITINSNMTLTIDKDGNASLSAPAKVDITAAGDVSVTSKGAVTIDASSSITLGGGSSPVINAQVLKDAINAFATTISAGLTVPPLANLAAQAASAVIDAETSTQKTKA